MSYESLQQLASAIRDRRTIKIFEQRAVDHNIIRDAIEVARWAPNHHLTEPWHFYLLNDDAIKNSIDLIRIIVTEKKGEEIGSFKAKDAKKRPGWLVVTCKKSEDELTQQEDYASVCCAIQNFSLYLSEAKLASKWATGSIIRDQRYYDLLNIDSNNEFIVGLIWYGYPKILPKQNRKEIAEIITYID
jgi:nitroreductase